MPKGTAINYSAEHEAFLLNNCKLTRKELTKAFNSMFAMSVSQQNIEAKCKRMGAMTGRTGRFEKGCTTWNANTKGLTGRNKTSFKKGSTPHNKKPMYSERICAKDFLSHLCDGEPMGCNEAVAVKFLSHLCDGEQRIG